MKQNLELITQLAFGFLKITGDLFTETSRTGHCQKIKKQPFNLLNLISIVDLSTQSVELQNSL